MPVTLIEHYRGIESLTGEMLSRARTSAWHEVDALRARCALDIDALRECARGQSLSVEEDVERLRVMRRIVVMEGEIRRLAAPRSDWLARMFSHRSPAPAA